MLAAGAPQHRADPGDELLEAERLGHVVVAADRQAPDLVLGRVAGGQEHAPGTAAAARAAARTTSKPSRSGSMTSSTTRSGRCRWTGPRRPAALGGAHVEAREPEARGEESECSVIFDDQESRFHHHQGCTHRTGAGTIPAMCRAMAKLDVAAGEGALRTTTTRPCRPMRKSSTSAPSRSTACARTPALGAHRVGGA